MPENATTITFKANISDLKKNIQEANRQIKVANAEFKAASAGMDSWSKSADGLSAKISATQKTLSAQKTILGEYRKQLELVEKEYGKNSKEADEMRIKVLNQEAAVKKTEAALKGYENQLKDIEKETKASGKAYEDLGKKIEGNEKKLEDLKKEYASIVLEQGKSSKAAKELAKEIGDLSSELDKDKKSFEDAGKAADDLDNSLKDTGEQAEKTGNMAARAGDGFTVMKGILADLAATAIKACIQGLKDLASATAEAWKEFDAGQDTVIKLTGATGKQAEELTKAYSNVAKNVLGDSTDIGKAIGEVNTRFGLTGKELEKLATYYVKFSDITDADIIGSIDDTQKALSAYGKDVSYAEQFLDSLAATAQRTGVNTSTLTSGIISNATAFQEMGLSLDQAVAFMGQLEKSGTNSETVLNGMRKALKNSTKDGKSLSQSLLDLQASIEGNGDSTKGLQAAYDLFGKSGDQIYGAIKNGTLSFKDLTTAMQSSKGAVTTTYDATMDATDKLKLKLQETKITLGETFNAFLEENSPQIEKAIDDIGGAIIAVIPSIKSALDTIIPYITSFVENDLPPLIEKIKTEMPSLIDNVIKKIPDIIKAVSEAVPVVLEFVNSIIEHKDEILSAIGSIVAALTTGKIVSTIQGLIPIIGNVVTKVKEVWTAVSGGKSALTILSSVGSTVAIVAGVVAVLAAAFVHLWETNEEFRNSITEIWDGIKQSLSEAGQEIVDAVNSLGFNFEDIGEVLKGLWDFLCNILAPAFVSIFSQLAEKLKGVIEIVTGVVKVVVGIIKGFKDGDWTQFLEGIEKIFKGVIDILKAPFVALFDTFKFILNEFSLVWDEIWNGIVEFVTGVIDDIKQGFSDAWTAITEVWEAASEWFNTTVIEPIIDFFSGLWEDVTTFAQDAWDGICSVFEGAVEWFSDVFQGVSDAIEEIMDGLEGIVKKPINAVIRLLNKFIDKINGIEIPDWVPEFGGKSINIKKISELERGGVLKRGQVGFLEGNGAEAVVPLEKNRKWIAAVTNDLKRSLKAEGMTGGGVTTIGGNTSNVTFNQYNNSPRALSRLEIYRQTRNQLSFANYGGAVNA